jgi:hypothetical protein
MINEDFGELARSRLGLGFKGIQPEWNTFKTVEQSKRQMNLQADSVIFSQKSTAKRIALPFKKLSQKGIKTIFFPEVTKVIIRRKVTWHSLSSLWINHSPRAALPARSLREICGGGSACDRASACNRPPESRRYRDQTGLTPSVSSPALPHEKPILLFVPCHEPLSSWLPLSLLLFGA